MIMHAPLHPGIIVKEALLDGARLTVTEAANHLGVTRTTLSRLMNGHANISPEMALRLSKLLGNSVELWVNLQAQYDVWRVLQHEDEIDVKPLDEAA